MRALLLCGVIGAISAGIFPKADAAPPPRSISTSRQFVVYGADARLRAGICDLAERTKTNALHLLRKADEWRTPIVINAHRPEANLPEAPAAELHLGQTGFGLKFQLDLRIGLDATEAALQREVLRSVLLELMYRNQPDVAAGTAYARPPEWLLEGIGALAKGRDAAALVEDLGPSVTADRVVPLQQSLQQNPALLESPLRRVYRAYCAALVLTLTESINGRANLARYVTELPRAEADPLADLRAHFPM